MWMANFSRNRFLVLKKFQCYDQIGANLQPNLSKQPNLHVVLGNFGHTYFHVFKKLKFNYQDQAK